MNFENEYKEKALPRLLGAGLVSLTMTCLVYLVVTARCLFLSRQRS